MTNKTEAPTVRIKNAESSEHSHPAYGLISVTRPKWGGKGTRLFDSAIGHNDCVAIQICTAIQDRRYHHAFNHSKETIVEFYMSEAQWAQFVASSGMGGGTPITFRLKPAPGYSLEAVPGIAQIENMKQTFSREMRESCVEYLKELESLKAQIEGYAENGKASKTQLKELVHTLGVFITNMPSNMAYTQKQFAEAMEKTTESAKTDIEAFVMNLALSTGLDVLKERQTQLTSFTSDPKNIESDVE